jgi:two-component system phosphate regulon sensor histidine kinase PhoR
MVLVMIGISVTGFFVSEFEQRLYKSEVEQRLRSTAALMDYQLSGAVSRGEKIDFNQFAKAYSVILDRASTVSGTALDRESRVTFVDYEGNVLGESDTDYQRMENHLDRKEIQEALKGNIGEDIRFSKTMKMDFLYIAMPAASAKIILRVSVPLVQLERINRTIWLYCIAGILAGLLLTSLLAYKFSISVTKPVNELIHVSKQISDGNYSMRADVKSNDELGQLARTFNEMADELDRTVADLTDKNIKFDSILNSMTNGFIAVDGSFRIILVNAIACQLFNIGDENAIIGVKLVEVIRNRQINELLSRTIYKGVSLSNEINIGVADEKIFRIYTNPIRSRSNPEVNTGGILTIHDVTNLKKLEQIRTDFVSNVTHELKTPLTSIRGFVETLRGGAINDGAVAEKFLEIIDIEAERLYMLINDILQLSEIETRQKDTDIGRHNLKGIIDEVVAILQVNAEKKGVSLKADVDERISILANRDRIKQMLINLIDNAIKYNVEKGSVAITASKAEGRLVITVKDTGIGIAQQHLSRIFERFYRVDKGRSRNMGGTGLGLSIVKHIVNLYNGDIKVESEPGKGTEFIIQLPV